MWLRISYALLPSSLILFFKIIRYRYIFVLSFFLLFSEITHSSLLHTLFRFVSFRFIFSFFLSLFYFMVIEILYAFCFYTFSKPSFFIFFVLIFTIANRSQNHVYMCLFAAPFKRCVIGLSYMEFTFMLYYIWELNDDEQIVGNNCRHVLNKCWIILDHQHTHARTLAQKLHFISFVPENAIGSVVWLPNVITSHVNTKLTLEFQFFFFSLSDSFMDLFSVFFFRLSFQSLFIKCDLFPLYCFEVFTRFDLTLSRHQH